MRTQNLGGNGVEPEEKWFYRLGGISAIIFSVAYIVIIALYAAAGGKASGGAEAWLAHIARNTSGWWVILGLSVLTDLLLVPIALSLYIVLKRINKNTMLIATAFVGLFVVLDLALTWTNYSSLITLSSQYATTINEAQKAVLVAGAMYPSSVIDSNLIFVYNTLTLSVGILLTGFVMLNGILGKNIAYLGLVTGFLGIVAVTSSFFTSSVSGISIILASLLTTVWYLVVGYRLYQFGRE